MTSIRKTKKALKREIRRIESQTDYSYLGVNDNPLQECATAYTNAWIVAFKESELVFLIVRCRVKSFHTKMMRKLKAMPESPKKEQTAKQTI
jgi:hypothetical protein